MTKLLQASLVSCAMVFGTAGAAVAAPMAPVENNGGHAGHVVNAGYEFIYGYAEPSPESEKKYELNPGQHILILDSRRGSDGEIWYYVLPTNGVKGWVRESQVRWR